MLGLESHLQVNFDPFQSTCLREISLGLCRSAKWAWAKPVLHIYLDNHPEVEVPEVAIIPILPTWHVLPYATNTLHPKTSFHKSAPKKTEEEVPSTSFKIKKEKLSFPESFGSQLPSLNSRRESRGQSWSERRLHSNSKAPATGCASCTKRCCFYCGSWKAYKTIPWNKEHQGMLSLRKIGGFDDFVWLKIMNAALMPPVHR